jgi:hypothetical protein
VGALLPLWYVALHELGLAAWPAAVLAGCLVSGVLLGAPQAWTFPSTARTRERWVLGTVVGLLTAVVIVGLVGLGRWPHPAALGVASGMGLGPARAVATGSRPTRWLAMSRWAAAAALGSAFLLSAWAGPWSIWGEGSWHAWAEGVTRPLRGWLGETPHEIAAMMLVGLLSAGIGGIGYGVITAIARPHASCGERSA